jgi:hypothetical protein
VWLFSQPTNVLYLTALLPLSISINLFLCILYRRKLQAGIEVKKMKDIVTDHLVQSFIRFSGASYRWYVNVRSGTVGDR